MKQFMIMDEKSIGYIAKLITIIEIDKEEYAIYAMPKDENTSSIYVSLITKDSKGNDILKNINPTKKERIFQITKKIININ